MLLATVSNKATRGDAERDQKDQHPNRDRHEQNREPLNESIAVNAPVDFEAPAKADHSSHY
jgi:hypothetical protein